MADTATPGRSSSRFFCHMCNVRITPLPVSTLYLFSHYLLFVCLFDSWQEYTCPRCMSGFIEELEEPTPNRDSSSSYDG